MRCGHGGNLTHWFTSDRSDWEVKWCEKCGALRKFNVATQKFQWVFPTWTQERFNAQKAKRSKTRIKVSRKK